MIKELLNTLRLFNRSVKLNESVNREELQKYGRMNHVTFPEDYLDFMEQTNGASLFYGRVELWKIPVGKNAQIPSWKSMEYMNSEKMKKAIPYTDQVYLIGKNELGDYVGITSEEPGYEIAYISPELDKKWYYRTFEEFLKKCIRDWRN